MKDGKKCWGVEIQAIRTHVIGPVSKEIAQEMARTWRGPGRAQVIPLRCRRGKK